MKPWQTTEDDWRVWRWPWDPRDSALPLPPRAGTPVPIAVENLTALAVCQASCPWRGGLPAAGITPQCTQGKCCPRLCRGCQAGWPYDTQGRHIGPVKYPHSNRWECNRVKWLGLAGMIPCGATEIEWINNAEEPVLWVNDSNLLVAWTASTLHPSIPALQRAV